MDNSRRVTPSGPRRTPMWVRLSRFLYGRLGVRRGVGRGLMTVAGLHKSLQLAPVPMSDGRVLYLDAREPMTMSYFLTGDIWQEGGETRFVTAVVRAAETAVDIGANVGWYSTLLSEAVGPAGRVFAFEPNAKALRMLNETARGYRQMRVEPVALSDYEGEAVLHVPDDGGQASLYGIPAEQGTQKCRVTTLDAHLAAHGGPPPVFIKCDAEGAEFAILRGAARTLGGERPPICLVEVGVPAAERLGYHPEELVGFFRQFGGAGYTAYRLHSVTGELEPLPPAFTFRFNALFVPACRAERVEAYRAVLAARARGGGA